MRVVVDTNCLLASISPKGLHYWLYLAFQQHRFNWLISNEVLSEYEEKLTDFYSEKTADIVLNILTASSNVVYADPYFKWNLVVEDPDDNKFADLAITGGADYLVTNDKHFSALKKVDFPKINVVTITEFKGIIWDTD